MNDTRAGGVWFRSPRPQRGGPPLTRERIVAEAIALLDQEGITRLTMRRLAERLGTGSTTLYWHVDTKEDVLDLALDAVFGEARLPAPSGDWRADITALIGEWQAAMLRHPWSAGLLGRPLLGPHVLERTEFLHATLIGAGLEGPHLAAAAYGLSHYVIGSAMTQAAWQDRDEPAAREAADRHVRAHDDRYPTLARHGHLSGADWAATFDRGLGYLLDGIAARLAHQGR
ncbi:TetR/AcrR family transcriptional regulator [Actinomadura scrupuli]|uniref:TetR/AcrR family transcriptional regulator n=1 Tax=Actinomadura scrupuli TaxID=559629 RepID=UPI003D971CF0